MRQKYDDQIGGSFPGLITDREIVTYNGTTYRINQVVEFEDVQVRDNPESFSIAVQVSDQINQDFRNVEEMVDAMKTVMEKIAILRYFGYEFEMMDDGHAFFEKDTPPGYEIGA